MSQRIRTFFLLVAILLGLVYLPAQAFLSSNNQNLWPVMSQHFTIPTDPDQTDIRHQIDLDLRHPKYIQQLTRNARPYLYYVFQETEKKHLPAELALLPMIESNYIPSGYSHKGAVGLWQLMPSTANNYGVKINSWYDGRRSTIASTKVALSFLSYLYQLFNHNWLLALAAYNAGPGTVQAAIHYNKTHGKPTNFWALHLPKETKVYIPKLLALAEIIQHPRTYGIHLASVPNKAVTKTVTIKKQMPLKTIAHLANTSVTTVKKLNPALKRSITPPHQTLTLVLPANKQAGFVKQMKVQKTVDDQIAQNKLGHYTVQHGDSLTKIASKFKTTVDVLQKVNRLHSGVIRLNQALLVPQLIEEIAKKTVVAKAPIAAATPVKKLVVVHHHAKTIVRHAEYTVKRGDTLRLIARHHHTTIATLMRENHLRHSTLQIGQHLELPQ